MEWKNVKDGYPPDRKPVYFWEKFYDEPYIGWRENGEWHVSQLGIDVVGDAYMKTQWLGEIEFWAEIGPNPYKSE